MAIILEFPRPTGASEPDDDIVSMLEDLLEQVRAGEVQSLVYIAAGADGHPEGRMMMDRGHATALIGALRVAEARIIGALDASEISASE